MAVSDRVELVSTELFPCVCDRVCVVSSLFFFVLVMLVCMRMYVYDQFASISFVLAHVVSFGCHVCPLPPPQWSHLDPTSCRSTWVDLRVPIVRTYSSRLDYALVWMCMLYVMLSPLRIPFVA